jgi:hypothetical protein
LVARIVCKTKLQNDAIEFVGDVIDECVGYLCIYPLAITLLKWLDNDMLDVDAIYIYAIV